MQQNDRTYITNVIHQLKNGTSQLKSILANDNIQGQTRHVIERMIKARSFAEGYLQKLADQPDTNVYAEHSFGSILHKMYPDMLKSLPASVEPSIVEGLQNIETQTHRSMQEALQQVSSTFLKSVLIDLNPRLNRTTEPTSTKMNRAS